MEIYYWTAPLLVVGGLIDYYIRSYIKVKAENRATREDMEQLLAQTAALTETTKRIEAEISGDLWDRQKRLEMKIDALSQALREVSRLEAALLDLDAAFSHPHSMENRKRYGEYRSMEARLSRLNRFWGTPSWAMSASLQMENFSPIPTAPTRGRLHPVGIWL